MTAQLLSELLELERKFFAKLTETMSLSHDLADAIDRQDQVALTMFLSMRQRPILELQEICNYIDLKRLGLTPEDAERFDVLVSGGPVQQPDEAAVAEQIASNHRLLDRLGQLDKELNRRLCGKDSFYEQTNE